MLIIQGKSFSCGDTFCDIQQIKLKKKQMLKQTLVKSKINNGKTYVNARNI